MTAFLVCCCAVHKQSVARDATADSSTHQVSPRLASPDRAGPRRGRAQHTSRELTRARPNGIALLDFVQCKQKVFVWPINLRLSPDQEATASPRALRCDMHAVPRAGAMPDESGDGDRLCAGGDLKHQTHLFGQYHKKVSDAHLIAVCGVPEAGLIGTSPRSIDLCARTAPSGRARWMTVVRS